MKSYLMRQAFIAFVGIAVSVYLVYHFVDIRSGFDREASFCNISPAFDCDEVAKSPFAVLFGIPVASYGLMFYIGYLLLLLVGDPEKADATKGTENRRRAALRLFLATLTLPVSVALAVISELAIQSLCVLCMLLYVVNIALFLLTWKDPELEDPVLGRKLVPALREGARELYALCLGASNSSAVRRWPLFGFLAAEVALVLLLPTVFFEGLIKPRAAERFNRDILAKTVREWREEPFALLPSFDPEPGSPSEILFGNPQAPVTVVEFSDFECPACHAYAPYLLAALERYKDKVRFVYKHFPIDRSCNRLIQGEKHQHACIIAQAAVCVGAQGRAPLWKFITDVFALKEVNRDVVKPLIAKLKLDAQRFQDCILGPSALARVKSDIELGARAGVDSTPSIFVNGKPLRVRARFFEGVLGMIIDEVESSPTASGGEAQ